MSLASVVASDLHGGQQARWAVHKRCVHHQFCRCPVFGGWQCIGWSESLFVVVVVCLGVKKNWRQFAPHERFRINLNKTIEC